MKEWHNRIVGEGEEAPDQLLANPANWRIHPKLQQDALAGILDEVGWVQRIIVNRTTGHLIDGHLRVTLALRRDEPTVPVLYVELTAEEEAKILATLDPISGLAVADKEKFDQLLHGITVDDAALDEMLSGLQTLSDPIEVVGNPDARLSGSNYYDVTAKTGYFGVGEAGAPVDYELLKSAQEVVERWADEDAGDLRPALERVLRMVVEG